LRIVPKGSFFSILPDRTVLTCVAVVPAGCKKWPAKDLESDLRDRQAERRPAESGALVGEPVPRRRLGAVKHSPVYPN
jgi:hypothetical protein